MKKYNIQNYIRYKNDMSNVLSRLEDLSYEELPGGVGGYQTRNWNDPPGEDSY